MSREVVTHPLATCPAIVVGKARDPDGGVGNTGEMRLMAPTVIEDITSRCVAECVRQGVGVDAVGRLLVAYNYALDRAAQLPTEHDVLEIAKLVDPWTQGTYRSTPVTFDDGGSGTDWREVPDAMHRLFGALDFGAEPAGVVRSFLRIHSFTDGNGRLAFVLYNWSNQTLLSPAPLPAFRW